MQSEHFEELVEAVAGRVPSAREQIRTEFEAVRDNGKLLTLSPAEVALLEAYRIWKRTADAAGGVFHYRERA